MFKHSRRGSAHLSRSLLAFAIALALPAAAVLAQDADANAEEADNSNPVQLDAVPVTAQRRSENIKDVPISITALSGEKLDIIGSGGDDIRVLASRVPSLNIESSFGRAFPRFYIRGLGN
ncbi:MAG: TonB-dependent receptor, partial [Lysobacterales bacterium CG_4_10_14_3_um_filter_64_11]